jgi:hypothetical protein
MDHQQNRYIISRKYFLKQLLLVIQNELTRVGRVRSLVSCRKEAMNENIQHQVLRKIFISEVEDVSVEQYDGFSG